MIQHLQKLLRFQQKDVKTCEEHSEINIEDEIMKTNRDSAEEYKEFDPQERI